MALENAMAVPAEIKEKYDEMWEVYLTSPSAREIGNAMRIAINSITTLSDSIRILLERKYITEYAENDVTILNSLETLCSTLKMQMWENDAKLEEIDEYLNTPWMRECINHYLTSETK